MTTNSLQLYEMPQAFRSLDPEADCPECHGEWVSVDGAKCPMCDGDAEQPFRSQLERYRGEVKLTALGLAKRVQEIEREAQLLEEHAAKVLARAQSRRRRVDEVKRWLQLQMVSAGVDKVKDEFVTVYLQDNPESFEIVDVEEVPEIHKRATIKMPLAAVPPELAQYVTGTEVLKTPLKDWLQETGEIPPGCEYHPKGTTRHLRIRS